MSTRGRDGASTGRSARGQSAILGLVLLIGVVATASVGILIIAADTTEDLEQQTENERIEQAFVELSQKMATTATTGDTTEIVDFDAGEYGAIAKTETGSINITGEALDKPINVSIGAIEYEGDDGTRIAYQAGGVFRETGNETRIVSAPPIHYDRTEGVEDDTFNFPVVEVSNEEQLHSGGITISHNSSERRGDVPILEESTVEVNVTSEYCVGWENYFRHQTREGGDAIDEPCDEGTEGSVIAELGDLERQQEFKNGVTVFDEEYADNFCTGSTHNKDCIIDPDEIEENKLPVLDEYIEEIVEKASNEEGGFEDHSSNSTHDLEEGNYYVDSIDHGDKFEFDLTDGNAILAVGGDANFGDIEVEGDNELKIYADGNAIRLDGEVTHEEGAEYLHLFGTSDMYLDAGPSMNGHYEGLIYIMSHEKKANEWDSGRGNCEPEQQAKLQAGQVTVDGALVSHSVCVHSNAEDFEYNEGFENEAIQLLPEEYQLPPNVYYLNIVEHTVEVQG